MIAPDQVILYAEDDENDAFLLGQAFKQAGITHPLIVVENGKKALDYLAGTGAYASRGQHPLPCLLLLDLNMPGRSGLELLKWIRRRPDLSTLPVLVFTSSSEGSDVERAYLLGVNGYLIKPNRLEEMISMAKAIKDYWLVQNRGPTWARVTPTGSKG